MKYSVLIVFLLLGLNVSALCQIDPRTYVAHKATDPIIVDGLANEDSWERSSWSQDYVDIEGVKVPKFKTRMKILWDDKFIYFFAELEEPHLWGTLKQRDTVIFHNNDFEVFIDPDGDTHNYYELEVNALNTAWDLFLNAPYRRGGRAKIDWNIDGLKTAVHLDGTLNDPTDTDQGWSVEIAIPWATFPELGSNDPADQLWRMNFSRVNWDLDVNNNRYSRRVDEKGERLPEYNWVWTPQRAINMHEPEFWGFVHFSPQNPGSDINLKLPPDEQIKLEMYQLYHEFDELPSGYRKELQVEGEKFEIRIKGKDTKKELTSKSPFTQMVFSIDHRGKFYSTGN